MTEDPWEVIRETLTMPRRGVGVQPYYDAQERALAALTTLREQMGQDARTIEVMDAKLTQANGSIAGLREQVERQEAALDRIARMDTGITADAPLSEAPNIARVALSTGEPSE